MVVAVCNVCCAYANDRKVVGVARAAGKLTLTVMMFVEGVAGVVCVTATVANERTQAGSCGVRVLEALEAGMRLVAMRRATSRVATPAVV
jgi:hypothetical protein